MAPSVSLQDLVWPRLSVDRVWLARVSGDRVWFVSENQLTGFGLAPSVSLQGLVWSRVSADRVWFGPSGQLSRKRMDHLLVDSQCAMGEGQINPQLEVISVD